MAKPTESIAIVQSKGNLQAMLSKPEFVASLLAVAPQHVTSERLLKTVMVAVSRSPKLLACTQASIFQAVMTAAELGLDCSGTLGSAYLVPFRNKNGQIEATFIPGYQGLIDLARRSGHVLDINPQVVYEKDHFDLEFGREQIVVHRPCLEGDRGAMKLVYAIAWLRDNPRPHVEWMPKKEIEKIRNASPGGDGNIWRDHPGEMWRKTVVRRICKYLPKSTELEKALQVDNEAYGGALDIDFAVADDEDPAGVEGLKEKINARDKAKKKADAPLDVAPDEAPETPAEPAPAPESAPSAIPDDVFAKMGLAAGYRADANRAWLLAMGDDTAPDWDSRKFLVKHARFWGDTDSPLKGLDALMILLESEAGKKGE